MYNSDLQFQDKRKDGQQHNSFGNFQCQLYSEGTEKTFLTFLAGQNAYNEHTSLDYWEIFWLL